jgi:hypothetical protein
MSFLLSDKVSPSIYYSEGINHLQKARDLFANANLTVIATKIDNIITESDTDSKDPLMEVLEQNIKTLEDVIVRAKAELTNPNSTKNKASMLYVIKESLASKIKYEQQLYDILQEKK